MSNDIEQLEPWLDHYASQLEPRHRRKLALKIGQSLRRSNSGRITRNEEPDGTAMADRIPQKDRKTGRIRRKGKMFRKIRLIRNLKLRADPNGVELHFVNPLIERTAAEHHFGRVGYVGKTRDGRTIKTRYTQRKLLGFERDDREAVTDAAVDHLKH